MSAPADVGVPILLAARINGVDQGADIWLLQFPDGHLSAPADTLIAWRLTPAGDGLRVGERTYFRLDDIAGLSYRVDGASQTLLLQVPASAFDATSLGARSSEGAGPTPSSPGGFLNYDLQSQRAEKRDSASGLLELGAFNRWGSGNVTGLWNSASPYAHLVRLDTTWNVDMPESMHSLRLGDAIGQSGSWGRSVRFGGVQWASNFATRPDFIPFALPTVRGEAALPSTVDVYVDNAQRLHGDLPAGPFDLQNVPVVTGQGEMRLVVRDLLGRQQVISQPYYVSQALLKPGLHDFSYEAGDIREDYGIASAHYGRFLLAATDRLGVTPEFTRELRAEVLGTQQTFGAGGVWLIPNLGTASTDAAVSNGPAGTGRRLGIGVQRQAGDVSFGLQADFAGRDFVQVGLLPGSTPRGTLSANLGLPVGGNGLGLAYLRRTTWEGAESRLLSASYSLRIGKLGQLGIFGLRSLGGQSASTIGLTLTLSIDERTSASVDVTRNANREQTTLQLQRNLPADDGFGYRLLGGSGQFGQFDASGAWQTRHGTLTAETAALAGQTPAYRAGASGGLAVADGGVFTSRRIDDSFAVVRVGDYEGIRVSQDNQEVGRTDRSGQMLVTRLRPYQTNPIGIDQTDLPLDAEIDTFQLLLTPALHSGVVAAFPVRPGRAASFRLIDENGQPLAPGSRLSVEGQDKEFPVGYDGRTFVSGLRPDNQLTVRAGGMQCTAELAFSDNNEPVPDLGSVICRRAQP